MVALARALMSQPQLLILDEPSLGLAPLMVEQVFSVISRLVTSQRSVLVAEQNVEASLAIAQRAYVLEVGKVTVSGTPAELPSDPALMRAFLGVTRSGALMGNAFRDHFCIVGVGQTPTTRTMAQGKSASSWRPGR